MCGGSGESLVMRSSAAFSLCHSSSSSSLDSIVMERTMGLKTGGLDLMEAFMMNMSFAEELRCLGEEISMLGIPILIFMCCVDCGLIVYVLC